MSRWEYGFVVGCLIAFVLCNQASFAIDESMFEDEVFGSHGSVMLLIDAESGEIVDANRAAVMFYGYDKNELIGMYIRDINTLNDDEIKHEMDQATQLKRNYFTFNHRLKNGTVKHVEVYSSPVVQFNGETVLFSIIHDITPRILAEEASLRNRQINYILTIFFVLGLMLALSIVNKMRVREHMAKAELQGVFDHMSEGFAVHGLVHNTYEEPVDYTFLKINEAFVRITNMPKEKILGKTVKTVWPDTENHWIQTYADVAKNQTSVQFINYSKAIDKYFLVNAFSVKFNEFITIFTDISDVIKTNAKIETERTLLKNIIEDAMAGYWDWHMLKQEEFFSEKLKHILGYDEHCESLCPDSLQSIIHTEDLPFFLGSLEKHIQSRGREPFYNEVRLIGCDNTLVWVICSGRVIEWGEDEKALRLVGCLMDITPMKRLEQAIKKERRLLRTTLNSIEDAVVRVDVKGQFSYMNASAERILSLQLAEVKGTSVNDTIHFYSRTQERISDDVIEKMACGRERILFDPGTYVIGNESSKSYVEGEISAIVENKQLNGIVIVLRDCSEKIQSQERIRFLSYHDQLTGLYNRHYFEDELKRLDVHKHLPLTLAVLDVNGLKLTNDAFGHRVGDQLLVDISRLLQQETRRDDVIARIGGDEFIILLPQTTEEVAKEVIERIKNVINGKRSGPVLMSVSIGVATKHSDTQSIIDTFNIAENRMYKVKLSEGQKMRKQTVDLIINTITRKSLREKRHCERVSEVAVSFGRLLHLNDEMIEKLRLGGLMHDVGKIAINQELLELSRDLTEEEYQQVKKHPEVGYHLLKSVDVFNGLAEMALFHHEKWDGSGYPRGLVGEQIPFTARILALCDAFEAMTSERPYRQKKDAKAVVEDILMNAGKAFDPDLAKAFAEHAHVFMTQNVLDEGEKSC